jgi:hypothetical protein
MKTLFICASRINNIVVFILLFLGTQSYSHVNLKLAPIDATHYALKLDFDIDEYDGIYEQYLSISIDDPDIVLPKLECSIEPTVQYAPAFKSSKSLFLGPCNFKGTIDVPATTNLETAHLYVTYRLLSQKHSQTIVLTIRDAISMATVAPSTSSGRTVEEATFEKKRLKPTDKSDLIVKLSRTKNTNCYPVLPELVEVATGFQSKANLELQTHVDIPSPQQTTLPLIPLGTLSFLCAAIGLFLLFKGSYAKRLSWRPFAAVLGMALIACSIVVATKAYQAQYQHTYNQTKLITYPSRVNLP